MCMNSMKEFPHLLGLTALPGIWPSWKVTHSCIENITSNCRQIIVISLRLTPYVQTMFKRDSFKMLPELSI